MGGGETMKNAMPLWALVAIHYLLSQGLGVERGNAAYAVLISYLQTPTNP